MEVKTVNNWGLMLVFGASSYFGVQAMKAAELAKDGTTVLALASLFLVAAGIALSGIGVRAVRG